MTTQRELYRFTEGTQIWTYTSADDKETHNNEMYVPIAIGRDEIESKNELSKSNITVTVSLDNTMGKRWMRTSVDAIVGLTIFTKDIETDNVMVSWKGRLASVKPDNKSIQLFFESIFTSLRRAGVRLRYQRTCPHVLYGNGCRFDKSRLAVMCFPVIDINDPTKVTIPQGDAYADGYFAGGMIEDLNGVARFIVSHVGEQVVLIRPLETLKTNDFVPIYPGCDRSTAMCKSRFDNILNNGSFPYIPNKNPFAITSLV